MQHTETYNLNLIETSDTFSPDPLNQNAQALEDAVEDARAEARAAESALNARVLSLEGKHIKCGMYTASADAAPMTVSLGFTPRAVFAFSPSGNVHGALFYGYSKDTNPAAEIISGGFRLNRIGSYSSGMCSSTTYIYFALD